MKKILLIEDSPNCSCFLTECLQRAGYSIELVEKLPPSPTSRKFQEILQRAQEFDLVIWDADVFDGSQSVMTFDGFIQAFAQVFKGFMLANSKQDHYRAKQMDAGCTHEVEDKDPAILLRIVKELLP